MTENLIHIELHPAYFAYTFKASSAQLYSQAQITHLQNTSNHGIDTDQLGTWLKSLQHIWNTPFHKIFIAVHGYPATLTPDPKGGELALIHLHHLNDDSGSFIHKRLNDNYILTQFIPHSLKNILDSYFLEATLIPSSYGICRHILEEKNEEDVLNLHITPNEGQFFYIKNNRPEYFNSFLYRNKDDLLYFTLLVYQTFNLSPDSFPLSITGMIEKDSEIYRLLYQYIRYPKLVLDNLPIETSALNNIQPHYLANLLYTVK